MAKVTPILVIICQPSEGGGGGRYPIEARLIGTRCRGMGLTVKAAIEDLWTSPAGEVMAKFDTSQRTKPRG